MSIHDMSSGLLARLVLGTLLRNLRVLRRTAGQTLRVSFAMPKRARVSMPELELDGVQTIR